jgi:hypothetical protein
MHLEWLEMVGKEGLDEAEMRGGGGGGYCGGARR